MIRIPMFAKKTVNEVSRTHMPEQFFDNRRMREISQRVKEYKFLPKSEAMVAKKYYEEHKTIPSKTMSVKFDLMGGEKFLKKIKL